MSKIVLGKDLELNLSKLNKHGFITGSTGSGKTITLKVITEKLSKSGVPVFLSDIKGDLASLIEKAVIDENISNRVNKLNIEDYEPRAFDAEFFDVFGENGIPLRTRISDMGPILLSKLMGLNDIQEGVLNIAFRLADERNLLLIDIKDLRAVLNFVNDNKKELSTIYGNISTASIGAILRSLLIIEQQGGNLFFGEPAFDISDFFRQNSNGEGIINILFAKKLIEYPKLYTIFMLWLLSSIYEKLPEVGDLDKPKMVFFFDEAHLIFDTKDKILEDKLESIVRLIRSKGVGVFFVTQKATDIPEDILAQLSNRIQHSLRAYTPKEQKEVKAIAYSFRQDGSENLVDTILNLKTGEAVFSILDEDSKPTIAKKSMIYPPESKIGAADISNILQKINQSNLYEKYAEYIDNESAYEILTQEAVDKAKKEEELKVQEEIKKAEEKVKKEEEKTQNRKSNRMTPLERFTANLIGSIGRSIGNQITRGIFGNRKR